MIHKVIKILAFAIMFSSSDFTLAGSSNVREDSLLMTSECDEEKSRLVAEKLFNYVDNYFTRFDKTKPLKDKVTVENLYPDEYEDETKVEWHDATFKTFKATYTQNSTLERSLWSLSTKSKYFALPFRVKLGQSMGRVQKILGPPSAISSNILLYSIIGEAISDVYFYFDNNKLVEVSWNYGIAD